MKLPCYACGGTFTQKRGRPGLFCKKCRKSPHDRAPRLCVACDGIFLPGANGRARVCRPCRSLPRKELQQRIALAALTRTEVVPSRAEARERARVAALVLLDQTVRWLDAKFSPAMTKKVQAATVEYAAALRSIR